MDDKVQQAWNEFLNPALLRPRLIAASIYIAAFESLTEAIVSRIRDFYWIGWDDAGDKYHPKYESEVLARNRSPLYASLDWLGSNGVLNDEDKATFERLKACRNTLAHELLSMLDKAGLPSDFERCLPDLIQLMHKIEMWWMINVEIPTNPELDGKEIDESEIIPGRIITLKVLLDVALGDEELSQSYYREMSKRTQVGTETKS